MKKIKKLCEKFAKNKHVKKLEKKLNSLIIEKENLLIDYVKNNKELKEENEKLKDDAFKRQQVIDKSKREAGYSSQDSFDKVWKETLSKAKMWDDRANLNEVEKTFNYYVVVGYSHLKDNHEFIYDKGVINDKPKIVEFNNKDEFIEFKDEFENHINSQGADVYDVTFRVFSREFVSYKKS